MEKYGFKLKWLSCNNVYLISSDGKEERPADNKVEISIPVRYDAGIVLSRWLYFVLP